MTDQSPSAKATANLLRQLEHLQSAFDATGSLPTVELDACSADERAALEQVIALTDKVGSAGTQAQAALEGSQTACLQIDRDLCITYANPATVELVNQNLATFSELFPAVDFGALIGTCIDVFHENPAKQRKILADPANLPYRAEIDVAQLKFALNISPLMDAKGEYVGAHLEWQDVTELRAQEEQSARLLSAVAGSTTASMQVDRDLCITGANPATIELVQENLEVFRTAFPRADFENLIGTCIDDFHRDPSFQRRILSNPNNLPHRAEIEVGALKFGLNITAMTDREGAYIGANLEWQNVTQLREQEQESARLKSAVAGSGTASMQVDRDLMITGANPATVALVRENIGTFQQVFPRADFRNLIGTCIDDFHQDPAFQRRILSDAANLPHKAEINVGDMTFALNITAMTDHEGEYIGANLEWQDITASKRSAELQRLANDKIVSLVEAARAGTLAERAELADLDGGFRDLVSGVNDMLDALSAPINEASSVLERLAGKDLTARMEGEYRGDLEVVKQNLNLAVENLESALAEVDSTTVDVGDASGQISSTSSRLADGASTQASSVEQISASLEEMSSMTSQNADNAQQAKSLATAAKESADRGDVQMRSMKEAIDRIKASSDETAKIVKTIDEISFQTNMLALNAAVEAARAGDAGKGFAVVAEEVRSLAQRSAEAAKNTAELIEGSAQNVDAGVELTESVQVILGEINDGSSQVTDLITEIAAASKEQAEGIGQVTEAIDQVNRVTQENAASSEEASAASSELSGQVQRLVAMVAEFIVDRSKVQREAPKPEPNVPAAMPTATPPSAHRAARAIPLDDDLAEF